MGPFFLCSMPENLSNLEFALNDMIGGHRLTPDTVDLPTLRGFLSEVEKLIKGDMPGASLQGSRVRIKEGSLKVVALVAASLAINVREDLSRLEATGDLDQIQLRRAEVIEKWQSRAQANPSRSYSLNAAGLVKPILIKNDSHLRHGAENAWVGVEKYLTGRVTNAGGKREPNIHLDLLESGESLVVRSTEESLSAEHQNPLYKVVTLRVAAEQHLYTRALRDIRLIQFVQQADDADERALANLWEKGRVAWREVPSATAWVEEMRGHSCRSLVRSFQADESSGA